MKVRLFNQDFVWHWWLVLVTLAAFLLLIKLSWWQWQRAGEKAQQLQQIAAWQQQGAPSWSELSGRAGAELDGAPLAGTAVWQAPAVWLVDNQISQGKAGYDVVIPVQLAQDLNATPVLLLVNLGWVAAPSSRNFLPEVTIPAKFQLQGVLRTRPAAFRLGDNEENQQRWPMRVQTIDPASLGRTIGQPLFDGVFYQQISPFLYHYQPVVLPPEKHRGYAVQWLLLALAVMMVAIAASYQPTES